jgi:glycosyltransferase involved in cell wall biosynthesis
LRILFITAALPYPPASGGALRAYGIIEGLAKDDHDLTLLTFYDEELQPASTPLAQLCTEIHTLPSPQRSRTDRLRDLFFTTQADIARRLYSPAFEQKLRHLIEHQHYDVIQFEGIEVACYLPLIKRISSAKIIFDTFNAEAELQRVIAQVDLNNPRRWPVAAYSWLQSKRINRYEGELCRLADAVIAVSPEDALLLEEYQTQRPITVVPSGINTESYRQAATIELGRKSLVFTGKMDYRPNVDAMLWFVDSVMPYLDDVQLTIVGQKPHAQLQALLAMDNITLTGWVDSVLPYLHSADVYIAPLRMGSGTRLKILEAMASGCAIVATDLAASGLLEQAKNALYIANDAKSFANAIRTLLDDAGQRQTLGQAAQQAVQQHYDWHVLIPRLLRVYEELGLG